LSKPLSILFEDEHCLALDKPSGQFAQGAWAPEGEETLETAVRRYLSPDDPRSVYLGIVHRLDRPTSGAILWAKTEKAARRLSAQFQKRQAVKEYWAVVESTAATEKVDEPHRPVIGPAELAEFQVWTDWLTRPDDRGRASAVDAKTPGAREAVTRLCTGHALSLPAGCSWLRLWPSTGRTHQLRIQAARRGTPILGDSAYGAARPIAFPERIALHARSLAIAHPTNGRELTLVAPLPSWWAGVGILLPCEPPVTTPRSQRS
jgi:23S rRNA pseudouridine1911/1915/1917 synthase